ncbi:TPA: AAA family ATPase [Yersinia enterocolitica]
MDVFFSKTKSIGEFPGIHFIQDHIGTGHNAPWDDFGFEILFQVFLVTNETDKIKVGMTKILIDGVNITAKYFIDNGIEKKEKKEILLINDLMEVTKIVSIGDGVDYYKKLSVICLEHNIEVDDFLINCCDAGYYYEMREVYSKWDGYHDAFLRNISSAETLIKKGYQIANGKDFSSEKIKINNLDLPETFEPIELSFNKNKKISADNINVIIGKNGLGKTFILKEIIDGITGLKRNDEISGLFHKIIVVAYSPFETFHTKDKLLDELDSKYSKKTLSNKAKKSRSLRINAYDYIGFKNDKNKFDLEWPKEKTAKSILNILDYDNENSWWADKGRYELLKETLSLALKFDYIGLYKKNDEIINIDNEKHIDLDKVNIKKGICFVKGGEVIELSSGQMMYSYMLPSIMAEIEDETLLVLDEPELYLHPSLEVGLIKMLKRILKETKSYAVIATHSAFIVREISKNNVSILREKVSSEGEISLAHNITTVSKPNIETFGGSLETIMGESFDDYYLKKPFENDIDIKIEKYESIDMAINELFPLIGDDAQEYMMSLVEKQKDTEITLERRNETPE